jgi:hypothetical protein
MNVVVIDLVAKAPSSRLWGRFMNANFASIMCQVVALWCEREGHEVSYICYTGGSFEDLIEEIPNQADLAFIGAFSQAGQLSYALSALLRSRGAVTVLGGPHARCYPEDSQKYFDYVLGFTDESLIQDLLQDCSRQRPEGLCLSSENQPATLPGVRERWKYIEAALRKAPFIKIVPMIGSLGCPYTCSFCIDSTVPYQALDLEVMQEDLKFLMQKFKQPRVGWYDPNFGIRFDETLDAIEEAVPPGKIEFIAESSLALLSEPHLKRLEANGFKAILPGIESWYEMGNKSKTGAKTGLDKVEMVAEHVNMILRHIPYLQANFVVGLDCDEGAEPFELTKRFIDLAPGAFPAYSLNTAFGQAAPLNLEYQRDGRVVPFPFHFMNNNHVMNVIPKNYGQVEFFEHLVDLERYSFSWPAIARRFRAVKPAVPKWMNLMRAVSSEGFGRIKNHEKLTKQLTEMPSLIDFWSGRSNQIPEYYVEWMRRDLGPLWEWLPEGALCHDPRAYLAVESQDIDVPLARIASPTAT